MLAVVIILNEMSTQSTKRKCLTLRNSVLIDHIDEEELEIIAQSIVENLCIEHDRAPKWELLLTFCLFS
jgi:hypothetical protein